MWKRRCFRPVRAELSPTTMTTEQADWLQRARCIARIGVVLGALLFAGCASDESRMGRPSVYQGGAFYEDAEHPAR
jgi:hypothetical protein